MLKALGKFFQQFESASHSPAEVGQLRLSVACLVQEVRRVDLEHDARERPAGIAALVRMFGTTDDEAAELLERAQSKATQLTSYYPIVSAIKRELSTDERVLLIEMLWRVAYADGALHGHEDHLIRKIAHLLYVPNTQVMLARGRAREASPAKALEY